MLDTCPTHAGNIAESKLETCPPHAGNIANKCPKRFNNLWKLLVSIQIHTSQLKSMQIDANP